jgi:DNA-binding IclR family transcriptional regulator
MTSSSEHEPGTLKRAAALMRLLAADASRGKSLTDLSKTTGLPHPTVHRLLQQLIEERLVRQMAATRRYVLGSLAFELGVAAAVQFDFRGICRPILESLASLVGDTVFFSMRSDDESVCLDLQEGNAAIRVVTLQVGSRRPLGAGAGGLAILGALSGAEREQVIGRVLLKLQNEWQLGERELRESLAAFDTQGHALIRNRLHAGISAVGTPVRNSLGRPVAALSVASINERMNAKHVRVLAGHLQAASREVEALLQSVTENRQ